MSTQILTWITDRKRELIFAFIIFLVATMSFGLGYLAHEDMSHTPIIIEKAAQ